MYVWQMYGYMMIYVYAAYQCISYVHVNHHLVFIHTAFVRVCIDAYINCFSGVGDDVGMLQLEGGAYS